VNYVRSAKFSKTRVWDKVAEEVPLFLEIPKVPLAHGDDWSKEAPMPKTVSIRSSVSIELMTCDRWTRTRSHGIYHASIVKVHSKNEARFTYVIT